MDIGEMLKRERGNQTQQCFANKLGISRTYLSDLENNRKSPTVSTFEKLVEKMGKKLIIDIV